MRITIEIDEKLWREFQKLLVDLYGTAYGTKRKEAINEAIKLWLELKKNKKELSQGVDEVVSKLALGRKIHPIVLKLLGEKETLLPIGEERKIIVDSLKER